MKNTKNLQLTHNRKAEIIGCQTEVLLTNLPYSVDFNANNNKEHSYLLKS